MEFDYKIYPKLEFVAFRMSGAVSLDFVKESFLQMRNDPDFHPRFNGVGDWRGITQAMQPSEAIELARFVARKQLSTGRWAGLVTKPLLTAIATVYKVTVEPTHTVELFSTLEGASNFMEVDVSEMLGWENS